MIAAKNSFLSNGLRLLYLTFHFLRCFCQSGVPAEIVKIRAFDIQNSIPLREKQTFTIPYVIFKNLTFETCSTYFYLFLLISTYFYLFLLISYL